MGIALVDNRRDDAEQQEQARQNGRGTGQRVAHNCLRTAAGTAEDAARAGFRPLQQNKDNEHHANDGIENEEDANHACFVRS